MKSCEFVYNDRNIEKVNIPVCGCKISHGHEMILVRAPFFDEHA